MSNPAVGSKPWTSEALARIEWIRHGFTHKAMGDMGISREAFLANGPPRPLSDALHEMGMDSSRAVLAQQVHSDGIGVVSAREKTPCLREQTDALICQTPGISLITFGADCPNVFLVDKAKKAIGLVHSGRLGTLAAIVPKTIAEMTKRFGCDPAKMIAAVSPSIGPCCYPTDLWAMLDTQFSRCGVGETHNERICTSCNADRFYSYRKTKDSCGRMSAALLIAEF